MLLSTILTSFDSMDIPAGRYHFKGGGGEIPGNAVIIVAMSRVMTSAQARILSTTSGIR